MATKNQKTPATKLFVSAAKKRGVKVADVKQGNKPSVISALGTKGKGKSYNSKPNVVPVAKAAANRSKSLNGKPHTTKIYLAKEGVNPLGEPIKNREGVPSFEKPEYEFKKPVKVAAESPEDVNEQTRKAPQLEQSRPYILIIKNHSFDHIKDFRVNNIKQAMRHGKEWDERVTVEYLLKGYSYVAFLSHFVNHPTKFARIRYEAFHGYEHYRNMQITACPLSVLESDPNGDSSRKPIVLHTAVNQFHKSFVEKRVDFDFTDQSWDLRLDLLPEATVRIDLFPCIIMNLWKQEQQLLANPEIGSMPPVIIEYSGIEKKLREEISALKKQVAQNSKSDSAFHKK